MDFTNQVAVVTGSSRGIGRVIALRLAQGGAKVVVNHRDSEATALEVVDEIKKPIEVTVLELQKDTEDCRALRARIRYGEGRGGWVLYSAITG